MLSLEDDGGYRPALQTNSASWKAEVPRQRPVLHALTIGTFRFVRCASAKGSHVAGQETSPEAEASSACPDCRTEMVIISITPILFVSEFEELTLACQKCGFSKILKIKRKSQ